MSILGVKTMKNGGLHTLLKTPTRRRIRLATICHLA